MATAIDDLLDRTSEIIDTPFDSPRFADGQEDATSNGGSVPDRQGGGDVPHAESGHDVVALLTRRVQWQLREFETQVPT